jgi:cysteine desulfurase
MFNPFSTKPRRVYLDNAGATKVSTRAKSALVEALDVFGNPSAIHQEGDRASQMLQKARNAVATILNAHSYEMTFVGTGTESCNLAILGTYLGAIENLKFKIENSRPHVIVSCIEHPAVLEPIKKLEREGKVVVTYLPAYENGIVKVKDLKEALTENTVLVSVMYANNEIGTLQPVKEIGRAIDEWKRERERTFTSYPYFHVDACQAGNYLNLDVVRLKCHLMSLNSSKVYGPKGIAALYKREGIKLDPTVYGGGQERGLRSGTESVALAASFAEALKESQEMREGESNRLIGIRDFFFENIEKELPDITIYGDRKERLPNNINIRVPRIPSDEMILRLDAKGFAVSHKSACASQETDGSYVVQALGATVAESLENVRITLGRDSTRQDMMSLVNAIKDIKQKFAK